MVWGPVVWIPRIPLQKGMLRRGARFESEPPGPKPATQKKTFGDHIFGTFSRRPTSKSKPSFRLFTRHDEAVVNEVKFSLKMS